MRNTALLLAAALALGAIPARAEEAPLKQRGFLSGLGLGLLVGGLVGVGAGTAGLFGSIDASIRLSAYGPTPSGEEMASVTALQERRSGGTMLAVVGFLGGGLALAGGVACLLIDTPRASVAFVPTSGGGLFVFSGRF